MTKMTGTFTGNYGERTCSANGEWRLVFEFQFLDLEGGADEGLVNERRVLKNKEF